MLLIVQNVVTAELLSDQWILMLLSLRSPDLMLYLLMNYGLFLGVKKHFRFIVVHTIANKLGREKPELSPSSMLSLDVISHSIF